jgi:hypothetical protein
MRKTGYTSANRLRLEPRWDPLRADRLAPSASGFLAAVTERIPAPYRKPENLLYESLARATTLRYFADHQEPARVRRSLRDDRENGFLWTDELSELLDLPADDATPRFAAAEASLIDFFAAWGREPAARLSAKLARLAAEEETRRQQGPQLVKLVPAAGATVVEPGATTLEIHFDRPMARSAMLLGNISATDRPAWDDARRVLRIPVVLEAGVSYRLSLNDEDDPASGFRSEQGEFLVPRSWSFSVRGNGVPSR